jgi:hypothetical protein
MKNIELPVIHLIDKFAVLPNMLIKYIFAGPNAQHPAQLTPN